MAKHINALLGAWWIIWALELHWVERVWLWWKSAHLYLAFLAFTDKERPADQLRRAALSAVLSAVYDFETDMVRADGVRLTDPEQSISFRLLDQHVESDEAQHIARELFRKDWGKQLSKSGIERGGPALLFYTLVIGSAWMRRYSREQILEFGNRLQVVDDLLDRGKDRERGHHNCFVRDDPIRWATVVIMFLASEFYRELEDNSWVYRLIRRKCKHALTQSNLPRQSIGGYIHSSRPLTGIFAAVLACASFRFYQPVPWVLAILASLAFASVTWSIMTYNNWVDRFHDRNKGNTLASDYPALFSRYLRAVNVLTTVLLSAVYLASPRVAGYIGAIWAIGLLYSHIQRWFLVQNLLVALCSASPALAGVAYTGQMRVEPLVLAMIFVGVILLRELYKDMEDARIDPGYKLTVPVVTGHGGAWMWGILLLILSVFPFAFYPHAGVRVVAYMLGPVTYVHASLMLFPTAGKIARVKSVLDRMIQLLLVVVLFTQ